MISSAAGRLKASAVSNSSGGGAEGGEREIGIRSDLWSSGEEPPATANHRERAGGINIPHPPAC